MAYFSNQGTAIHSGAAGYGPLKAYQDGSLGRYRLRSIYSHRGQSIYNMSERNRKRLLTLTPKHRASTRGIGDGPLMAFQDGSLGGYGYGPMQAFQDGSLGASGAGPLMSFQDGSLGMPLFLESNGNIQQIEDPVSIHHGSMGEYFAATGEYFTGMAGCRGCGLGQDAGPAVLDLSDPDTLAELKLAMASAPWVLPFVGGAADEIELDLANPTWTPFTTQIVDAWMSGYHSFIVAASPEPPKNADGSLLTPEQTLVQLDQAFPLPDRIPTPDGVFFVFMAAQIMMQPPAEGQPPLIAPGSFPILQSFLAGADKKVLPPVIASESKQGNMLAVGLTIAAIALVGVAVMGSKKRGGK